MEGYLIWLHLGSVLLAAIVAAPRNATATGVILALLFGPLGLLATMAIDNRHRCPECQEHVTVGAHTCPHCRERIGWDGHQFYSRPTTIKDRPPRPAASPVRPTA